MKSKIQRAIHGVAVLCMGVWVGGAVAATALAPTSGTVQCVYGSPSAYLDIGNGTCSEWNHRAMLQGSTYYKYYGGCASSCSGGSSCNGGAGNYYVVTGANGWDFRQSLFNANVSSGTKTCDRCALGLIGASGSATGPLARSDNRQYGTRKSAWLSPSLSCGQSLSGGEVVGYPML
ncbi:peptidase M23 [Archangium sp.]|uniref:peptidase M23 n=1 Tax=Archangium sp. TaxID=1872627 RepID=UPI002D35C9A7|nr:peptidase M23 [Archangium sp.]HYO56495.1 peptidase M23 [Archangium sp.]